MQEDKNVPDASDAEVKQVVKNRYGTLAQRGVSGSQSAAQQVAEAFGYSADELASIPAESNLGVSCGNPTALASLKPAEVVLDLGSGGGLDVFLAAKAVGPTGWAIGVDMTEEMVQRARLNAESAGLGNVEFHLAEIESLPLPDQSVDCVISNCVLNLVPNKAKAFAEIFRVLKPGGRLAVADLALKEELPPRLVNDFKVYVGCIGGAMLIDDYRFGLTAVGFDAVQIVDSGTDLNAYAKIDDSASCFEPTACCDSTSSKSTVHEGLVDLLQAFDINQFAASVKVFAVKPTT